MNTKHIPMARRAVAALLCSALLGSALLASCATNKKEEVVIGSPDLGAVADGAWKGSYGRGMVKVEVEVEVAAHRIESVKILKHRNGKGKPAEGIVDFVIAAQSLQVDLVSGATASSKCILKAIETALEKGLQ